MRRALAALAQPAAIQRALFPELSSVGDELARVFDAALHDASNLSADEQDASARIEAFFLAHGGAGHADFWDDLDDPRWGEVRALARQALEVHGWPAVKPQPHD